MNLTSRIILAMVLAMAGGIFLKFINDSGYLGDLGQLILLDFFTEGILDVVGQIFIASLRLVMTHQRQISVTIQRLQHLHSLPTSKLLKQLLLMTMATASQDPAIPSTIPLQLKIQET